MLNILNLLLAKLISATISHKLFNLINIIIIYKFKNNNGFIENPKEE